MLSLAVAKGPFRKIAFSPGPFQFHNSLLKRRYHDAVNSEQKLIIRRISFALLPFWTFFNRLASLKICRLVTNEFQSPPLFILLHCKWISQQVGVGPVQMCTLHSEQCTQCTVYGMYTMYSAWNVHSEQCMECTVYNTFCCRGISAVVIRFSLWIFY